MGRLTRESGPALWLRQGRGTQPAKDPATDPVRRSVAVARWNSSLSCWAEDHEEAETQEGKIGRRVTNPGSRMQIDSREEECPEDEEKAIGYAILGTGRRARSCLHLGGRHGQPAGETSRGHAGGEESSELHERIKPLKGEILRAPPA
jgi:hypothetical protein